MFLELNLGRAGRQYVQAARYSAFAGKMPLEPQNGRLGRCRVVHFTTEVADLPPGARTSRPFGRESGIFSKEKERAPRHLSGRGARLLGLWVDQLRTVPLMPWAWRSRLSPPQNCSRGWSIKTSSGRISWSKTHNLNQMILPITMKSPLSIVFLLGSSS